MCPLCSAGLFDTQRREKYGFIPAPPGGPTKETENERIQWELMADENFMIEQGLMAESEEKEAAARKKAADEMVDFFLDERKMKEREKKVAEKQVEKGKGEKEVSKSYFDPFDPRYSDEPFDEEKEWAEIVAGINKY